VFFLILSLNCCTVISESPIVVGPNSEFYLDITLVNPDPICGKYIIIRSYAVEFHNAQVSEKNYH